jgi:cytochrome c2
MRHFVLRALSTSLLALFVCNAPLSASGSADLLIAVRNGDHQQVRTLIEAGADVNIADDGGTTALMHAVIESDAQMMKLLIDHRANVNAKNALDSTALMYAATNLEKTRLLLDAGADVKAKGQRGATAMGVAVTTFGSTPVLKLLVGKGAQPEARQMTSAAAVGDLEAMQYLLSAGIPSDGFSTPAITAAITARCEACARWLVEKGAPAGGVRPNGTLSTPVGSTLGGVLNDAAKRAMPELSQFLLDHGASLDSRDREGFTLLMQAVLSMQPPPARDRMVEWLLSKGVDPNAKNDRGDTAYQLAARVGTTSTLAILAKAGAKEVKEDWPLPAGASSVEAAMKKAIPLIEMSGEPGWKSRQCVSCHSNSLPAMTVSLARQKGLAVNDAQAKKELGFAIATDEPVLEDNRLGASPIGGGSDTLGYTLLGMAAAGAPAGALTDAHIHFISLNQYPDGAFRNLSYRPPLEYSPFTTTALAVHAIKLYAIPGRQAEFDERAQRAKRWLLSAKTFSMEEQSMQLNALADAGASASERAPFVQALKAAQNKDGSWSQLPETRADAYATGEALYALHVSGSVPASDPTYQKGVQWLLRNQLADGSWFAPSRAVPVQPHTFESFPNGWHQFVSDAASCWATMALLFTLPDRPAAVPAPSDLQSKQDNKASEVLSASYTAAQGNQQGSPADAAQGKQIFANKCAVCHDADTRDTQVGPGLKDLFHWAAHSLSDGTVHQQHTVEIIRKQIVEGGGLMEPVGASFSDQEIADLIAYLRTL